MWPSNLTSADASAPIMIIPWIRWLRRIAIAVAIVAALVPIMNRRRTMEAFEPPKYLTSLIAAVNDGAKSAQAGAFLFLLVGLYLLATAFSASDEDLLLGKAVTISQIGASLPVSFSFAIAPLVFVFLHVYTLVRYDMLAANVRQFVQELRETVPREADRERCRQLLTNVEFIVTLTTPRGSALYSRFWPWLFRG